MNPQVNYFLIPEERLGVLIDFDFEELHRIEKQVKNDWIKNNKCDCVKNLKSGKVLRCEHLQKAKLEKTQEIRTRLRKKCFVSQIRTLVEIKRS